MTGTRLLLLCAFVLASVPGVWAQDVGDATQPASITVALDKPLPPWADDIAATDTVGAGPGGPSAASTVYLGPGVYQNNPDPDISASNPTGPDAVFQRLYRTSLAANGYASPGLSAGWTHVYDTKVLASSEPGWAALTLVYHNGARESLTPVLENGAPKGKLDSPKGAPYVATGQAGATAGRWDWLMLDLADGAKWLFQPDTKNLRLYRLTRIADMGKPVAISYDAAGRLQKIAQSDGKSLLAFAYDAKGYLSTVTSYDGAGKAGPGVKFAFGSAAGTTCLAAASQIGKADTVRWAYGYEAIAGRPFLNSVGVPSPTGKPKLSIAYVEYDSSGRVECLIDANNNRRCYKYSGDRASVESRKP